MKYQIERHELNHSKTLITEVNQTNLTNRNQSQTKIYLFIGFYLFKESKHHTQKPELVQY